MATPPASDIDTAANTARTAIRNAANTTFINAADIAIADAASRGHHLARLTLFENVDLQYIVHYYQNLGYVVAAPFPPNIGQQPAQLFGEYWKAFWENPTFYFTINGFPQITEVYITWYNP